MNSLPSAQRAVTKFRDFIPLDGPLQCLVAMRVQVVGPDEDALFPRGDRERSDSRHHVADCLTGFEFRYDPVVFGC